MRRTMIVVVAAALALTTAVVQAGPASAADTNVDRAAAWLKTQQQADGGFEVAQFPGFETPDAVLAIASAAQTGSGWSTQQALAAIQGTTKSGNTALDNLDDLADNGLSPAQAAKLIMLVVAPLGLNLNDFDPQDDSPNAVDLFSIMTSAAGNGSYASMGAAFNGRLYAALALRKVGQPDPAALVSAIVSAQQANGSWSFDGSNSGTDFDADTTGLAIQALVASGSSTAAPAIAKGVRALALNQQPNGAWQAFGSDDPNSTSLAILGIAAAGGDVTTSCWRDAAAPTKAGDPYTDPQTFLLQQQAGDGHFASPNDGFGLNTFATSQSVEALTRGWLPIAKAPTPACDATPGAAATANAKLFVDAAFQSLLGRKADAAAQAAFAATIVAGGSPVTVARRIMATPEYLDLVVTGYFHDYLGTTPSASELATYGAQIKAGHRTAVQVAILSSPAFTKAHPTSASFVDALYRLVLGRDADAAARARWTAALDGGTSRAAVAKAIVSSGEARSFVVKGLYQRYLGRAGDAGGVTFWRGKLGKGTSVETVIASMVGSSEFVTAAQS